MKNEEMKERLNENVEYLNKRKDFLFTKIQDLKENIEHILVAIREHESYIRLESENEQLERNIFNLYDTTDKYVKEKKQLSESVDKKRKERIHMEGSIEQYEKELEEVTMLIASNRILINSVPDRNAEKENENIVGDIAARLEFCLSVLEPDKMRCRMELEKLLEDISVKSVQSEDLSYKES